MKPAIFLCLGLIASASYAAAPVSSATPVSQFSDNPDMGCVDPQYAAQVIEKYGINVASFPGGQELCDNDKPFKQMLDTFVMIDNGKIGPTKKQGFDHAFMAPDYVKYFRAHIHNVVYDDECGEGPFIACVINQMPTMHVQAQLFEAEALADQVATLIHEARHVDGYRHVMCDAGPLKGVEGSCDQNFDEAGSYAVEVEYEARMALDGENFNPVFKTYAREAAIGRVEDNFVEKPSSGAPYLLLVDKADGHLIDFAADGKALVDHAASKLPAGAMLVDRSVGANVILADRGPAPLYIDYYTLAVSKQSDVENIVGLTAREFADKWTPARRESLVGIGNDLRATGEQVRVFRDSIEAITQDNTELPGVPPPDGEVPASIGSTLPCYRGGQIQTGFFLRMESNDIYKITFGEDNGPLHFAKQSCSFPADLTQAVKYKNRLLGLDRNGKLWSLGSDGTRTAFFSVPNDARRFQSVVSAIRYSELSQ